MTKKISFRLILIGRQKLKFWNFVDIFTSFTISKKTKKFDKKSPIWFDVYLGNVKSTGRFCQFKKNNLTLGKFFNFNVQRTRCEASKWANIRKTQQKENLMRYFVGSSHQNVQYYTQGNKIPKKFSMHNGQFCPK